MKSSRWVYLGPSATYNTAVPYINANKTMMTLLSLSTTPLTLRLEGKPFCLPWSYNPDPKYQAPAISLVICTRQWYEYGCLYTYDHEQPGHVIVSTICFALLHVQFRLQPNYPFISQW